MLTALLWITLITSIILLTAIAAPIRVSCKAIYKEEGRRTELNAAACYMHPLILRAEYSSANEQVKFFILGFEKKSGVDKDGEDNQDINEEDTDMNGLDNEDISINTDAENIDTESVNTEDADADNINIDGTDTEDNINAAYTDSKPDAKEKTSFGLSKIKSTINDIKRNRLYKIISDKPLRKKLLRWLKLSFRHITRAISFEKLKLHARIGLQDPATLGKIYGYFSAAQSALTPRRYNIDLSMEPVFTEKCLDIDSEAKIKTTLSIILWQLIIIAGAFPYLRLRKMIRK